MRGGANCGREQPVRYTSRPRWSKLVEGQRAALANIGMGR